MRRWGREREGERRAGRFGGNTHHFNNKRRGNKTAHVVGEGTQPRVNTTPGLCLDCTCGRQAAQTLNLAAQTNDRGEEWQHRMAHTLSAFTRTSSGHDAELPRHHNWVTAAYTCRVQDERPMPHHRISFQTGSSVQCSAAQCSAVRCGAAQGTAAYGRMSSRFFSAPSRPTCTTRGFSGSPPL